MSDDLSQIPRVTTRQLAVALLVALIGSSVIGLFILKSRNKNLQIYSGQLTTQQTQKIIRGLDASAPKQGFTPTEMSFTIPRSNSN